jgi:hypothetical protein
MLAAGAAVPGTLGWHDLRLNLRGSIWVKICRQTVRRNNAFERSKRTAFVVMVCGCGAGGAMGRPGTMGDRRRLGSRAASGMSSSIRDAMASIAGLRRHRSAQQQARSSSSRAAGVASSHCPQALQVVKRVRMTGATASRATASGGVCDAVDSGG